MDGFDAMGVHTQDNTAWAQSARRSGMRTNDQLSRVECVMRKVQHAKVPSHHRTIDAWKRGWTPMWWYPLIHDRQQESYEAAIEKV